MHDGSMYIYRYINVLLFSYLLSASSDAMAFNMEFVQYIIFVHQLTTTTVYYVCFYITLYL